MQTSILLHPVVHGGSFVERLVGRLGEGQFRAIVGLDGDAARNPVNLKFGELVGNRLAARLVLVSVVVIVCNLKILGIKLDASREKECRKSRDDEKER